MKALQVWWLSKRRNSIPLWDPKPAAPAPGCCPSRSRHLRSVSLSSVLYQPPQPRCHQARPPPSLPPSLAAGGTYSGLGNSSLAATAGSKALVDAVPPRAVPPSGGHLGSSLLGGAPSAPAQCPVGGRSSESCQRQWRRRRRRRPSVFSEEKHETDRLALPPPFPRPEPLSWLTGI